MKRIAILLTGICFALTVTAQTDSSRKENNDTIRVGSMIIIKHGDGNWNGDNDVRIYSHHKKYKPSNLTTNWIILDLGFNQLNDKTDYSSPGMQDPVTGFAPGSTREWFKLRSLPSSSFNLWFFMQKLNLSKHIVNLKYGLGIEWNNYYYKNNLIYETTPTMARLDTTTAYKKDKLAADYLTVPLMLNFDFTPGRKNGFGISVGASAGYLYSSRQKSKSDMYGKQKVWDDFELKPWKISYICELQIGYVKLYGTYATESMFSRGLNQTPYSFGIRFSN